MRALLLVGLCGCEAVFGVGYNGPEPTVDAGDTDASDAVTPGSACPPPGMGLAPTFQPAVTPVHQNCSDYSETADRTLAAAVCAGQLFMGTPGNPLFPGSLALTGGYTLVEARISPEGDELFVVETNEISPEPMKPARLSVYRRASAVDSFQFFEELPLDDQRILVSHLSAPSARLGNQQRVVITNSDENTIELEEWRRIDSSPSDWQVLDQASATELDVQGFTSAHLSADGLRVVFMGAERGNPQAIRLYYRDRASLDQTFGPPTAITPVSTEWGAPYLTEDCSQLYFRRMGGIWRIDR